MEYENRMTLLTPYELARKPQALPSGEKLIQVTGRFLEAELSCAICLGLLKNTRTTKECLHRFCNECISQALRSGNKECPNCRKKLASMRSLRPDPIFDNLIKIIFPNREEMETQERKLLEKLNSNNNRRALLKSIEEGKKFQAERRGRGVRKSRVRQSDSNVDMDDGEAGPSASTSSEADSVLSGARETSEVTDGSEDSDGSKIFLEIIPNEMKLSGPTKFYGRKWGRRIVKVLSSATIGHLAHFILYRLSMEGSRASNLGDPELDSSKIQIDIRVNQREYHTLLPQNTLSQIRDGSRVGDMNGILTLAFTIAGKMKVK